jgi:hypothetical protein
MNYRKLRIAWSVGWASLCLLLIMLWVRSYWKSDGMQHVKGGHVLYFGSNDGRLYFQEDRVQGMPPSQGWSYRIDGSVSGSGGALAQTSHSAFVLLFGGFTVLPWLPWRFSVRTLLIAVTVIAAGLGVFISAMK